LSDDGAFSGLHFDNILSIIPDADFRHLLWFLHPASQSVMHGLQVQFFWLWF
jgi:hypothetical protein